LLRHVRLRSERQVLAQRIVDLIVAAAGGQEEQGDGQERKTMDSHVISRFCEVTHVVSIACAAT